MTFLITKSLFVDYHKFPKLAWLRVNDLARYQKATKTDSEDMRDYIMELGKTVEHLVGDFLISQYHTEIFDAFPDSPERDEERDDDDDTWIADVSFQEKLNQNLIRTKEAILRGESIIYQPGFQLGDCYVRSDYLVLSKEGKYDLIEVKAKSNVRKEVTDDGEKKKIGKIEDEFLHDVAFQRHIINQVFASWGLPELGKLSIAHVNSEYVKQGDIQINQIITIQKVGAINEISVIQRKKSSILLIDDTLETNGNIQEYIDTIRKELILSEEDFGTIHPFPGNKYLEYFGVEKPFGTIYCIPYSQSTTPVVKELHEKNIIDLKQVPNDELGRITGKGSDFLEKYFRSESQAIIQKDKIRDELLALKYPICFYDYESISTPIPLLNGVSPYQQAVVQYSLHKLFEDGHIEHFGAVLVEEGETMMRELNEIDDPNLSHQTNRLVVGTQEEFLQLLLDDIGENLLDSSFVVWYKDFENSRNKEIAEVYPSLSDGFLKINDNTYDLFEVFRQYKYFDQKFRGSASIKKVLPVLVPELSYDNLVIGKGDKAMNKLAELLRGSIVSEEEKIQTAKDLLIYCRQDSWAMVEIYKKLLETVNV